MTTDDISTIENLSLRLDAQRTAIAIILLTVKELSPEHFAAIEEGLETISRTTVDGCGPNPQSSELDALLQLTTKISMPTRPKLTVIDGGKQD